MLLHLDQNTCRHLNSVTHEGKVIVVATDADGGLWYTVKQDGFEDSYLSTPESQRTGWENWQALTFPNERDDASVLQKERVELTYEEDNSRFIMRSRYKTQNATAVAPVQLVSALGHVYVFRQSKHNTLLVDRFVLDGMTNRLNRKLDVRFKRSQQKYQPSQMMRKGSNGLENVDSLDFRDANNNYFYEPTTELCLINNLNQGWFAVVLVPTVEHDVHRWHIFAYNQETERVELTTIRASQEGLFDVKDYTYFEEFNETLVPQHIPGVIRRSLNIAEATVTNGLAATKYNLQEAGVTQSGEEQLQRTAARIMLAIPTNGGTAVFSFAIAGDGTLSKISESPKIPGEFPKKPLLRGHQREVLLPLNTLDEIKAYGD
ncbi:MAG TPA: LamG domain-containing protein, partial [Phormidium sp.]